MNSIAREESHPVIRWLMTEARKRADSSEFLDAFARELRASGVDVSRITTGVPILHPQIFSFSGLWELGKGTTERLYRTEPRIAAILSNSPIGIAYEGRGPVRCDLAARARESEFSILEDLRRDGYTDYIVHSVPFADGSFDLVVSINTIHNLERADCVRALAEIERVGRRHRYVQVDSWLNESQREKFERWQLTARTYSDPAGWRRLFAEAAYRGDYYWTVTE